MTYGLLQTELDLYTLRCIAQQKNFLERWFERTGKSHTPELDAARLREIINKTYGWADRPLDAIGAEFPKFMEWFKS